MNNIEEDSIDLLALAKALWKNILVIALAAVLVGSMAFGYTAFMLKPQYQAKTALYVNSSSFRLGSSSYSISASEMNTSNSLVSVYLYILKSRTTMEEVIAAAGLNYSPDALLGMISAKGVTGTAAFEVTVTCGNPSEAELIANTIAKILPDRISDIVEGSSVRIVDYAIIPSRRSGPDIVGNTVKGVLAGAVLGAAVVVLITLMQQSSDQMLRSADDLREMYPDIMVLAMIPDMSMSEKKNGYYSSYYKQADKKKEGRRDGGKQRA